MPGEAPPSAQAEPEDIILLRAAAEGIKAAAHAGRWMSP